MRVAWPSTGSEPARRRGQGGYIGSRDAVHEGCYWILPDEYAVKPNVLYRSVEDDLLHGPWVHVTERGKSDLPLQRASRRWRNSASAVPHSASQATPKAAAATASLR